MSLRRTCLILAASALTLLTSAPEPANAASGDIYRVTAERVNLRSGPSDNATVRSTVEAGDELIELQRQDDWLGVRVSRTGEEGWIFGGLVEQVAQSRLGSTVTGGPFTDISAPFDGLIGEIANRLGYPIVDGIEQPDASTLRVRPSQAWLINAGREAHMMAATAFYQLWKNYRNQGQVTVLMTGEGGQDYIAIEDTEGGPRLMIREPGDATAER